jgi:hypothetical protein
MEIPDDLKIGDAVEYIETVGAKYNFRGIAVFLGFSDSGNCKLLFANMIRQDSKNFSTYEVTDVKKLQYVNPAIDGITLRKLAPDEIVDF